MLLFVALFSIYGIKDVIKKDKEAPVEDKPKYREILKKAGQELKSEMGFTIAITGVIVVKIMSIVHA